MTAVLYLLPLGLIFDLFGYLPPAIRLAGVYALLALPLCLKPSRQAGWLGVGLALAVLVRAWLPMPAVAEIGWLLLMHQAVWTVLGRVPGALRVGTVAYGLVYLALFASPLGHPVAEGMAAAGNQVMGWVGNRVTGWLPGWLPDQSFNLGPTYQGLASMLLFLTLSVFVWDGTRVGVARTVALVPLALLVNALGAAVLIEKADFAASFAWSLKFREPFGFPELWKHLVGLAVIGFPKALFIAHLVIFLVLHGVRWAQGVAGGAGESGWGMWRAEFRPGIPRWVIAGLAALVVLAVVPPTAWRRPVAREMVFVERGVVSFTKPDYTRYGEAAGGMFGMLPEYAALFGCKSTVVKDVPAELKPEQVLVLTNLDLDLGEDARRRIWDFVAKGGALWVLGDHTFIKNDHNFLNELLEPCHISFNNDSAQFFPQGWFHSYRFPQGTPFAGLKDEAENRPGILVGASLDLGVPAEPLVFGRFGYGDAGLEKPEGSRGYLGDFKYQRSERLGDLVLVAGERHGKGRVLVFGDTSSFFNNNLTRSYELLRASLGWLGESNGWSLPASAAGRGVAVLLVAGLLALAFIWRNQAVAAAGLLAIVAVSLVGHGQGGLPAYDQKFARQHLALIDFSHQPNASKHSATDAGLHGVGINLMRHGELPVAMNSWDPGLLDQARYLVINAPRRPITGGERRNLMDFMKRGGTVILGCGYLDAAGSKPLLEPLGLEISGTPLGRFFDLEAFGQRVSFMSAWALAKVPQNARVLCTSPDWPLIVAVPVGKGELVLISDSEFLHNRNVEGHKNHDPANTAFLKNLLDSTTP
ncbi:MAG: hypothetical protein K9N23_02430 [Akkermansiaceae bacterium]|nr:hypothetical protein [Akkermansiaceae bacterium]